MSKNKPSLPTGTRDFDPATVRKRRHIFDTIRDVFELYGYQPLETPALEMLETLMGKYGEEGDKLIFKILNNGLGDPKNIDKARAAFEKVLTGRNDADLTERALRYDLTIPFARYVAMNHAQLTYPFRRYQMQPVWRADRPQKGRYREFYQCDADVVGSTSLLNEVELASIYATVFKNLGIPVEIRVNNRKILAALAAASGGPNSLTDITIAIDKLDKIGPRKSQSRTRRTRSHPTPDYPHRKISRHHRRQLRKTRANRQPPTQRLACHRRSPNHPPISRHTTTHPRPHPRSAVLIIIPALIFEVKALGVQMGSIGGGGRYDDLTGLFGVPDIPGVGISFGVDRIYDVMDELQCFPPDIHTGTKVLFFHLGEAESRAAFGLLLQQLRAKGIPAELFHEHGKFDKQFKYAEKKGIPYVVILGSQELSNHQCQLKDLRTGEQTTLSFDELTQKTHFA